MVAENPDTGLECFRSFASFVALQESLMVCLWWISGRTNNLLNAIEADLAYLFNSSQH